MRKNRKKTKNRPPIGAVGALRALERFRVGVADHVDVEARRRRRPERALRTAVDAPHRRPADDAADAADAEAEADVQRRTAGAARHGADARRRLDADQARLGRVAAGHRRRPPVAVGVGVQFQRLGALVVTSPGRRRRRRRHRRRRRRRRRILLIHSFIP